ncbi:unnamed protein product [Dovyalis caffra]|uniref:Glycoside hydrolase family 19 catalytic domain-containing protein n=1 Tax=Dovyalis caffra TaxID=77055 RepID=A0AAV1R8T7_9ROSI|nr:unnamed protein product [Dovyalis caffra]
MVSVETQMLIVAKAVKASVMVGVVAAAAEEVELGVGVMDTLVISSQNHCLKRCFLIEMLLIVMPSDSTLMMLLSQPPKNSPSLATLAVMKRAKGKLLAFFGQTSHETTGGPGWNPPQGPFFWGYCYKREINCGPYCQPSTIYPCAPGKSYCGRGPIQLTWQPPKPSRHDVVTDNWTPTNEDVAAGRAPGYGVITNIINGGIECGKGPEGDVGNANNDRIGFYKRYCGLYGIDLADNLDCFHQRPFGNGLEGHNVI